jgi:hypothetical protein
MGRVINPDYFKVGAGTAGSGVSKLGRFGDDRSRLAATLARLHREAPHRETATLAEIERPRKRRLVPMPVTRKAAKGTPPPPRSRATGKPATSERSERSVRPVPSAISGRSETAEAAETSAVIELFHTRRPMHGHKRRSSKKRHEVAVLRSLATSEMVPPPAQARPVEQPKAPRDDWRDLALDLLDFARELALTPVAVARILVRLRREKTPG